MLFLSKRPTGAGAGSGAESCLSLIGLLIAIGLIAGLSAMIYGLVVSNSSATIAGGAIFAISFVCGFAFVLVLVFCLEKFRPKVNQRKAHARSARPGHAREVTGISVLQSSAPPSGVYPTLPYTFADQPEYGFSTASHAPANGYQLRSDYGNHY